MVSRVIVTKNYTREFDTPLVAPEGTVLEVLKRNDGIYTQWFICKSEQGIEAFVPEEILQIEEGKGILLSDYSSWELSVKIGEILVQLQEMDGWIWARNSEDEYGWVPSMNVKEYK